jgi:peptide deformylase
MSVLKIFEYPDPILKEKSSEVEKIDDELRKFMDDMLETMYDATGVGLAAPQVGVSKRIIVIDIEQDREEGIKGNPIFMINPEVIWRADEIICGEEGCISIPEQRAEVERFAAIRVKYLDYHGKEQEITAEGYAAIVVQHELDHLDGILYIDRISRLKRNMLLKKLEKLRAGEE